MEFREIITIAGQPGLFRYIAQGSHGVIVEALSDGKRTNATGSAKISSLAEIALFVDAGEMPLAEVFTAMFKRAGGKEMLAAKSSPELLKAHFAEVVPEYDRDRVHVSDMKKIVGWFNMLLAAGMTDFSLPEPEPEEE